MRPSTSSFLTFARAVRAPAVFSIVALSALLVPAGCSPTDGEADGPGSRNATPARTDTIPPGSDELPPRGEAWVIFGADTVRAEVASTASQREQGLMYREALADGTGMLFVFESEEVRSFWMKNTYVPLSIAYLDSSMRIVDIQRMEPEVEELYESSDPAMFALEVPQGWFDERGIREGDRAEIVFGPR